MAAILKLVHSVTEVERRRPFKTYYYDHAKPTRYMMSNRVGHARTQAGALKAAAIKLASGAFRSADVYNDAGTQLYSLRFDGRKLTIVGKFHEVGLV